MYAVRNFASQKQRKSTDEKDGEIPRYRLDAKSD